MEGNNEEIIALLLKCWRSVACVLYNIRLHINSFQSARELPPSNLQISFKLLEYPK
jgi:hypothetical protein